MHMALIAFIGSNWKPRSSQTSLGKFRGSWPLVSSSAILGFSLVLFVDVIIFVFGLILRPSSLPQIAWCQARQSAFRPGWSRVIGLRSKEDLRVPRLKVGSPAYIDSRAYAVTSILVLLYGALGQEKGLEI